MSYTVAICLPNVPAEDDVAWSEVNARADDIGADESPAKEFQQLHDDLTAQFPCICTLPDDKIDEGVWSDGPLINNFGQQTAVLSFVFSAVAEVLPVLIVAANSRGMTIFDWQTETIHRPNDMVLTLEDEDELRNPTVDQLNAGIARMTPNGGPGFVILEGIHGYVQAAGGDGLYTVEWRQYLDDDFLHLVAGKHGDTEIEVEIPTNGFQVTVMKNECLETQDVKMLFKSFLDGDDRPTDFTWRDVTERFV